MGRIQKFIEKKMITSKYSKRLGKFFSRMSNEFDKYNYSQFKNNMFNRMRPEQIFGTLVNDMQHFYSDEDPGKVKVRIFHQQANMWNSIKSVYYAFCSDPAYSVRVVLTGLGPDYADLYSQMKELQVPFIGTNDYDVESDRPDISIVYLPMIWPRLNNNLVNLSQYSKLTVSIPVMLVFSGNPKKFKQQLSNSTLKPDYCFLDKLTYEVMNEYDTDFQDYLEIGHSAYDSLYNSKIDYHLPKDWKKIEGKKILVWSSDHGLRSTFVSQDVAVDLYFKSIVDYFSQHNDCALIFRPHTSYIRELILNGYWSYSDYESMRKMFDNSPNMIWDDKPDYSYSFCCADMFLCDVNCSMNFSSLLINKPSAVLLRNDMPVEEYSKKLTDSYYHIRSENDLISILDKVLLYGQDPMFEKRQLARKNCVSSFDGKNGIRIKEKIAELFEQKNRKQ